MILMDLNDVRSFDGFIMFDGFRWCLVVSDVAWYGLADVSNYILPENI